MQNMEITPRELRDVEIKESLRGYNRDDVNDVLERAAATLEAANERIRQLTERLSSAQTEAGRTRETEDILHRTLLLAQRAADEAVAEATAKARQMVDDSEIQSRRTIADAEAEARRRGEAERQRLEKQVVELAGRRDALLADVEALNGFESEYRDRMTRALEADLTALRTRPSTAPGRRPEVSDVEIPVVQESVARRDPASPPTREQLPEEPEEVPAPVAAEPVPEPAAAAGRDPVPPDDMSPSTREVDVRALFETNDEVPPSEPVPAHSYDLLGPDALDSEVLDDDAFFATLRDAVHDEAPLGPRGEDDLTPERNFFDQDAERGTFRDVFRRRR